MLVIAISYRQHRYLYPLSIRLVGIVEPQSRTDFSRTKTETELGSLSAEVGINSVVWKSKRADRKENQINLDLCLRTWYAGQDVVGPVIYVAFLRD